MTETVLETKGYLRIKEVSLNFVRAMKLGGKVGVYRKEPGGEGKSLWLVSRCPCFLTCLASWIIFRREIGPMGRNLSGKTSCPRLLRQSA